MNLAAGIPADNNSSACETRLMSELSPRLQTVITSFDNSLRRDGETPQETHLSAMRCPWQPQAYCNWIDISHSACIQSSHSALLSLALHFYLSSFPPQSATLNQTLITPLFLSLLSFLMYLVFVAVQLVIKKFVCNCNNNVPFFSLSDKFVSRKSLYIKKGKRKKEPRTYYMWRYMILLLLLI